MFRKLRHFVQWSISSQQNKSLGRSYSSPPRHSQDKWPTTRVRQCGKGSKTLPLSFCNVQTFLILLPCARTHPVASNDLSTVVEQGAGTELLSSLVETDAVPDINQWHHSFFTSVKQESQWSVIKKLYLITVPCCNRVLTLFFIDAGRIWLGLALLEGWTA